MRILVIEDDKKAARLLAKGLQEEGLVVDVAYTGEVGDEMASVSDYAAIVLDWLLPDKDGIAVCRDLRERGIATPILMLTARDALADRVTGLDAGAEDRAHGRPGADPYDSWARLPDRFRRAVTPVRGRSNGHR